MFADPRVRHALGLVYDFQWANKNLFYGDYVRSDSYFENSDLASSGLPAGDELKLLEPFRQELPPELFTQPFTLPVTDGSGNNRAQLVQALQLLQQAGWQVKDRKLVDANGQQMRFDDPAGRSDRSSGWRCPTCRTSSGWGSMHGCARSIRRSTST